MVSASAMYASAKRQGRRWNPFEGLFPQQLAYVRSKAKRKAAICTRRAGKTTADARDLIADAQALPGSVLPYFAVTRKVARRLMWTELVRLNNEHDLGFKLNHTDLEAHHPNGSQIWICGAKDETEIEKARGPKYRKVILDEAASFRRDILKKLINEILEPALMDLDGTLCLTGTPGAVLDGLFYDVTRPELAQRQPDWDVHSWSLHDNPYLPNKTSWLERLRKRNGWTETTPAYMREYRGMWVRADDVLIYDYEASRNDFDELPAGEDWHFVLGIDVGLRDSFALAVVAYSVDSRTAYVVETLAKPNLDVTDMAEEISTLRAKYEPERLVMDCGALGAVIAEELRRRHSLPIQAAEKTEKRAFIELLNSDLRRGYLRAESDSDLVREEWGVLQWVKNDKEDPTQHNDLADAVLYAWRWARNFMPKDKGAKAATDAEREQRRIGAPLDDMERRQKQRIQSEKRKTGWW